MADGHDEGGSHEESSGHGASKELEDLKKLTPTERIKRLQELEKARKAELEEAEKLIKESQLELAEAEEKKRIPIPEARATDLSTLATLEEKQIVSMHHFIDGTREEAPRQEARQESQKNLEEVTSEAAAQVAPLPHSAQHPMYGEALEIAMGRNPSEKYFSQRPVTAGAPPPGSIGDEVMRTYEKRAGMSGEKGTQENPQEFYTPRAVTGSYELHKREQDDRKAQETYRRHGPA